MTNAVKDQDMKEINISIVAKLNKEEAIQSAKALNISKEVNNVSGFIQFYFSKEFQISENDTRHDVSSYLCKFVEEIIDKKFGHAEEVFYVGLISNLEWKNYKQIRFFNETKYKNCIIIKRDHYCYTNLEKEILKDKDTQCNWLMHMITDCV